MKAVVVKVPAKYLVFIERGDPRIISGRSEYSVKEIARDYGVTEFEDGDLECLAYISSEQDSPCSSLSLVTLNKTGTRGSGRS